MAFQAMQNPSSLKLKFDCGKNSDGETIYKSKTYAHVKPTAEAEALYNVGVAIADLSAYKIVGLSKIDNTDLLG
jgi:hypothetical protein